VKPHPYLLNYSSLIDHWLEQSKKHQNVIINTDPNSDITQYFHESDLMLSDVSSVALAWFLVDKPLVCLINGKLAEASGHYSPDGLEWKMHDAALVVDSTNDLCSAIRDQLNNPIDKSRERIQFSNLLFGEYADGKASYRVAERITRHVRENND
jgi:CDP-glycerol glycerophosphotransferase (TagB/SpsB family)